MAMQSSPDNSIRRAQPALHLFSIRGWHRARLAILVYRNISQYRLSHLDAKRLGRITLRVDFDIDGDRRRPHLHDPGVETHHVTDEDRLLEHERIHRYCCNTA